MGLFSFLSRRTGNKGKAKTQDWDPTLPGSHNQGGLAVADNDQTTREAFYGGRTKFAESQPSLDTASEDDIPAPAPGIPRFKDGDIERPSTAPNERPSSVTFPASSPRVKRNGQKRPPPLSFRVPRPETAGPGSRPSSRGSITTITNAFRRVSGHSRTSSLRSDGTKAFRDILDAHSEIRPADFRARVQATGARDYGEDVAERNLGENGFDLGSEHVQAFYTQSPQVQPGNGAPEAAGPKLDRYKAGVRRRSVLSSQHVLPRHLTPRSPLSSSPEPTRKQNVGRRRSVITYVSPGFDARVPPQQKDTPPRSPELEIEKLDFGFSALKVASPTMPELPETASARTIRNARLPRDSVEIAKKRAEVVVEDVVGEDSPASNFDLWSATRSRRSSTILSATSNPRKHRSLYTLRSSVSSSVVSRDTVLHTTPLSHPPKTAVQEQAETPEGFTHEVLKHSEEADALTASGPASIHSLKSRSSIPRIREEEVLTRSFPLLSPNGAALTTLPDDLEYPPPIRTRSMRVRGWSVSSGTPTAAESTTAGSIATSSSHPFNRPPSLYTADTSVDLSIGATSPQLKPAVYSTRSDSITTLHFDADGGSVRPGTADTTTFNMDYYMSSDSFPGDPSHHHHHALLEHLHVNPETNPEPALLPPSEPHPPNTPNLLLPPEITNNPPDLLPEPAKVEQDTFNIDDYLSSDAESLSLAPPTPGGHPSSSSGGHHRRRPTGEGEEGLLMSEAWFGVGLPGLGDMFPSPSSGPSSFPGVGESGIGVGSGAGAGSRSFPVTAGMGDRRVGAGRESGRIRKGRGGEMHMRRRSDGKRVWAAAAVAGEADWGSGKRVTVMDLPLPLSLHSLAGSRMMSATPEFGSGVARWDGAGPGTRAAVGADRKRRGVNRVRERNVTRRFVLNTAADDESTSESGGESEGEQPAAAGLALDDDGYDADYIEDESEGLSRRRRRKKRTRRLSALCRLEGEETENRPRLSQQDEPTSEAVEEKVDDKIAAAVRLRKQVMRARRLAGQPSAAMLRRKPSANQRMGANVSVPVVRVDEAER